MKLFGLIAKYEILNANELRQVKTGDRSPFQKRDFRTRHAREQLDKLISYRDEHPIKEPERPEEPEQLEPLEPLVPFREAMQLSNRGPVVEPTINDLRREMTQGVFYSWPEAFSPRSPCCRCNGDCPGCSYVTTAAEAKSSTASDR